MVHVQRPLRALLLGAALAPCSAIYIRSDLVFARDDVCGGVKGLSRCAQAGLPDNFCCGEDTNCMSLAGDTTVLCCPKGSSCDSINPIVCDLTLQDASKNPSAAIKTTVLGGKLDTCGGGCCPFGYSCVDDSCLIDDDQSKKPAGAPKDAPTSSATGKPKTSTPSPTSTSDATSALGKPTETEADGDVVTKPPPTEEPHSDGFPTAAVVGGVVGSVAGVIALTALIMVFRHRRKQADKKRHDSTSSFGNIISNPQPLSGFSNQRQDFLAKATTSSVATTPTQAQERFASSSPFSQHYTPPQQQQPYSRFDGGELMAPSPRSLRSYHPSAEIGGLGLRNLTNGRFSNGPATPRTRRLHSTGSGNINIFTDAETLSSGGGRRDTTWTNIMAGDPDTPPLPDTPTPRRR